MQNLTKETLERVPGTYLDDVLNFLIENNKNLSMEQMTPREFLDVYLIWNGLRGYTDAIIELMQALGWKFHEDPPRIMSDEDRERLMTLLLDVQHREDFASASAYFIKNGTPGLLNMSDSELLDQVEQVDLPALGKLDDVSSEEAIRILLRYRNPEALCKKCGGIGAIPKIAGLMEKCPDCFGSGLAESKSKKVFMVLREETVLKSVVIKADSAKEAAEVSKSMREGEWQIESKDSNSLQVFGKKGAADVTDGPAEPLYEE